MTSGQPASDFRYWAFVSYSHKDKSWAQWLHKALESYRVPHRLHGMPIAAGRIPPRLAPVFRDRDELPTASDLGAVIEDALRQSWCLIVICSPDAAKSRWINEEVLAFQRLGRGDRIHCLIVESGGDAAAPIMFPPALTTGIKADGRPGEPVAADARRYGDGRSHALLKLIAGILGISYDTLFQREQQRRHRNLFIITCASLALVVVLATATLIAVTSRRDAIDQRGHAESLVEFMIGDLRKKLEPDGKLATLDAVGKEALAYYAAQKSENLDAEALARRARALHMIGEVYDLRGELDEALKVFEQAADSTAELLKREPDNGQRVFDHAQSVYWVGYIAYQRGSIEIAEPAFQEYKRLAETMTRIDPANEDWQAEVGYANSNLGTLLYEQGRLEDAAAIFDSELENSQHHWKLAEHDIARQMRLAQAHAHLGNVQFVQGRLHESAEHRQAESAIYEGVIAANPGNSDSREALSISQRSLGRILLDMGEIDSALDKLNRSIDLVLSLAAADPDNTKWLESEAAAYTSQAEALTFAGKPQAALESANKARALATKLVERDPSVVAWQLRLIKVMLLQAQQLRSSGDSDAAFKLAKSITQRLELPAEGQLRTWERTDLLVKALVVIGDTGRAIRREEEAVKAWATILELVENGVEARMLSSQAAQVFALCGLGRPQQADPVIRRLREIGYREPSYLHGLRKLGIPDS